MPRWRRPANGRDRSAVTSVGLRAEHRSRRRCGFGEHRRRRRRGAAGRVANTRRRRRGGGAAGRTGGGGGREGVAVTMVDWVGGTNGDAAVALEAVALEARSATRCARARLSAVRGVPSKMSRILLCSVVGAELARGHRGARRWLCDSTWLVGLDWRVVGVGRSGAERLRPAHGSRHRRGRRSGASAASRAELGHEHGVEGTRGELRDRGGRKHLLVERRNVEHRFGYACLARLVLAPLLLRSMPAAPRPRRS